jgi:hypothetical protein
MDTVLYIVLGIAVMAYQAYSEKKKKEARSNARNPVAPKENSAFEELEKDLESFGTTAAEKISIKDRYVGDIDDQPGGQEGYGAFRNRDEAPEVDDYKKDTDVEKAKGYKEGEAPVAYESINMHEYDGEKKNFYDDQEKDFSYDKDNHDVETVQEQGLVVDPRLFVIYSELAKPKFNE